MILCCCLGTKQGDGKYKHTVDLPKTTFGMRANSAVREPELQKLWDENQVFMKVAEKNNGVSLEAYSSPLCLLHSSMSLLVFGISSAFNREVLFFMMDLRMLMVIYTSDMH